MAALVATITVTKKKDAGHLIYAYGSVSVDNGDYASGGVLLDFSPVMEDGLEPLVCQLTSRGGYICSYLPTTGKMKIFTDRAPASTFGSNAPLPELAAAAAPAALQADVIDFIALFEKTSF